MQRKMTIQHITAGCTYLATVDYLQRHNQMCNIIYQTLANKYGLLNSYVPYYKYQPTEVLETDSFKLYYDRVIIIDRRVTNNRPDVLVNRETKTAYLIDVAVPNHNNKLDKYQEKKIKYAHWPSDATNIAIRYGSSNTDHCIINWIDTEHIGTES